jgi:protein-tyrosine phosphatase
MKLLDNIKRTMARAVGIKEEPVPRASRRILFVCMGNICRSPTAEGVFRKLLAERAPELDVDIDSAGTHGYHDGAPPDPRACRAAERRGIDLRPLRARRVTERDFEEFELVLAMDEQNREFLLEICPVEQRHRIRLLLEFAPHLERREVPDPYYGGSTGFEHVLDLVEEAAAGLLEHLRNTPPPRPGGGRADEAREGG